MDDHARVQTGTPHHEPIEIDVRPMWITGVIITIVVTIGFLVVFWLMSWFSTRGEPLSAQQPKGDAVKPDPDWNVPPQLEQLRTREQRFLGTYGWVDQTKSVARVPVDRAIELIAEKGLPPVVGAAESATSVPLEQDSSSDATAPPSESGDE
jgi:hypothetical protein